MNTPKKSWYSTLCEFFLRRKNKYKDPTRLAAAAVPLDWPAVDPEKNDRILTDLKDTDPSYQMFMGYARAHFENCLETAMRDSLSSERKLDFLSQAAGVRDLIADIETTREKLVAEKLAKQRREEKRAK